jgi:hypothetical protein
LELKETYENRVVLFLDILGFKNILSKTVDKSGDKDVPEKILALYKVLYEMTDDISVRTSNTTKVITQFSDSIVVSFEEDEPEEIFLLFEEIQKLIIKLVSSLIICRGAISYGKLIHTEEIIFGPALVDAYETESKAAMYPRVILDKSIADIGKKSNKYKGKEIQSASKDVLDYLSTVNLEKDTDEKYYIDYFTSIIRTYDDIDKVKNHIESLKKIILDGQKFKSPDLKVKYGWMKNKYNRMIDDISKFGIGELKIIKNKELNNYLSKLNRLK